MGNQTDLANQRGQQARQKDAETAVGTARAAPKATGGEVWFLHALITNDGARLLWIGF